MSNAASIPFPTLVQSLGEEQLIHLQKLVNKKLKTIHDERNKQIKHSGKFSSGDKVRIQVGKDKQTALVGIFKRWKNKNATVEVTNGKGKKLWSVAAINMQQLPTMSAPPPPTLPTEASLPMEVDSRTLLSLPSPQPSPQPSSQPSLVLISAKASAVEEAKTATNLTPEQLGKIKQRKEEALKLKEERERHLVQDRKKTLDILGKQEKTQLLATMRAKLNSASAIEPGKKEREEAARRSDLITLASLGELEEEAKRCQELHPLDLELERVRRKTAIHAPWLLGWYKKEDVEAIKHDWDRRLLITPEELATERRQRDTLTPRELENRRRRALKLPSLAVQQLMSQGDQLIITKTLDEYSVDGGGVSGEVTSKTAVDVISLD